MRLSWGHLIDSKKRKKRERKKGLLNLNLPRSHFNNEPLAGYYQLNSEWLWLNIDDFNIDMTMYNGQLSKEGTNCLNQDLRDISTIAATSVPWREFISAFCYAFLFGRNENIKFFSIKEIRWNKVYLCR